MDANKYYEDITNKYIYDVTRRLPSARRAEVDSELRITIDNMIEKKSSRLSYEDINEVLQSLGRPSDLANRYRDNKKFIIGPRLYDKYFVILRIVMIAVGIGVIIANIISFINQPVPFSIGLLSIINGIFNNLILVFGYVTITFLVLEKIIHNEPKESAKWDIKSLPDLPIDNIKIKRIVPIIGLILSVFFLLAINSAHELLGVYFIRGGFQIVPIFNSEVFIRMVPILNIIVLIGVFKEFSRLFIGRYNPTLAVIIFVANIMIMIIVVLVFTNNNIWNDNFVNTVSVIENSNPTHFEDVFNLIKRGVILIFAVPIIYDTFNVAYKSIKYNYFYK